MTDFPSTRLPPDCNPAVLRSFAETLAEDAVVDPQSPDRGLCLADTIFAFTPVPMMRRRADGWTVQQQSRFIRALSATGSVVQAAKAVSRNRASAYRLRARRDATSFAEAWDRALQSGRDWMFAAALDRAFNGVTTVTVVRGGTVRVTGGPDMAMVGGALRGSGN